MLKIPDSRRQRAPSKRSLATKERIFDAAEIIFADRGFEGASIGDIAAAAGVQKALVSFHGGSKEGLFAKVIERRASELAEVRLIALAALLKTRSPRLKDILECFIRPLLEKATKETPQWQAYVRLIAQVSADPRWRSIAAENFDPAAKKFIGAIGQQYPDAAPETVASGFVFTVSAMLSLCTSQWRVTALGEATDAPTQEALLETLINFCNAGMCAVLDLDNAPRETRIRPQQ